ncbi:hypothetical protein [Aquisphaera insulae]|uniref:hypothetical protein n=1 Tax=Aquisphaera insulae TaxID=2712864 RepID=UPI0013EC8C4A|nr:hypothetical protein [Aquisphaera insulae]
MSLSRYRRSVAILTLAAAIPHWNAPPAGADDRPAASALGAALAVTRSTGAATVAVFTSRGDAPSRQLWDEFDRGAWARANRGLVQVVNIVIEDEPGLAKTAGVIKVPAARVYTRSAQGVSHLATIGDCSTARALEERLMSLQIGIEPPAKADARIDRASHNQDIRATPQGGWPAVQTPQPVATSPVPTTQQFVTMPSQPTVATTTTANVIQVPSQPLLIQQPAPQVFMAPQQAPVVYVPQGSAGGPMMMASPAPAPTANMLLSVPSPQPSLAVAAPQPSVAVAAPAPTVAAAPTTAVAVGAAPTATTVATMTNHSLSLPSSSNRTRVRVRGPGLVASSLARFGERLTKLGQAKIETIHETTLEAPSIQSSAPGTTTISTTSTAPVSQPPSTVIVPIQQQGPPDVGRPPCPPSAPNYPVPSSQDNGGHHGH